MGLETYTNRIKEFWEPAEIEPERPGEIYSHARRDLPRVIAKLSIGIVLVGAFRMAPIFVAILAILYVCIHGFSKTFARYMEHGADRIAYPMAVCVWALIGWQAVTLGGQATMEVIYRMKVDEDAAYQRQVEAHPGVVAQFQAEEKAREDAWKEREKGRMEREKIRQAGNDQSTRRARTLLTLSRENKQIKVSGSIAAEETPAEPAEVFTARPLPVLVSGPTETAPQFLTKWAFRLKLWQLGEFGVALAGLLTLLLCRVSLNRKGREMMVAVQDRELLPLVTITRETIGKLAEWRAPISPSLPLVEVENEVLEAELEIRESGERGGEVEAPCPIETTLTEEVNHPDLADGVVGVEIQGGEQGGQTPEEAVFAASLPETEEPVLVQVDGVIVENKENDTGDQVVTEDREAIQVDGVESSLEQGGNGVVPSELPTTLTDENHPDQTTPTQNGVARVFLICDGNYKLKHRADAGWDLKRVKPGPGVKADLGSIPRALAGQLLDTETDRMAQWILIRPTLIKKGVLPPDLVIEEKTAEVVSIGRKRAMAGA